MDVEPEPTADLALGMTEVSICSPSDRIGLGTLPLRVDCLALFRPSASDSKEGAAPKETDRPPRLLRETPSVEPAPLCEAGLSPSDVSAPFSNGSDMAEKEPFFDDPDEAQNALFLVNADGFRDSRSRCALPFMSSA